MWSVMRTEDLIEALARDVTPVRPAGPPVGLLLRVAPVLLAVIWLTPALRPELGFLIGDPRFWIRAAYLVALAATALWLADRLGRPGTRWGRAALGFGAVVATAAATALLEQAGLEPGARRAALLGQSWTSCPPLILVMALVATPLALLGARRFAPTRPALMGGAVGLMTGAAAAIFYSLHCPELTASFVAVWYTLGVLASGGLGALAGRYALRW
jgi:hypothetical protein